VALALALVALPSSPQINTNLASAQPVAPISVKRGASAVAKVHVRLMPGYHMNSNTPADEYLIPLKLTWTPLPLEAVRTDYPPGKMEKYGFSEKPLSVITGDFDIATEFKAPASAPVGTQTISGKLRYQACDTRACYPPRTIEVKLNVDIQ
jgi:hypothetical protein